MYSKGELIEIVVPKIKHRSDIGRYMNAVRAARRSNDPKELADFVVKSVTDAAGKSHEYETDLNTLYYLASSGSESFEEIYKYVI